MLEINQWIRNETSETILAAETSMKYYSTLNNRIKYCVNLELHVVI